jgi:hypothetical protein
MATPLEPEGFLKCFLNVRLTPLQLLQTLIKLTAS